MGIPITEKTPLAHEGTVPEAADVVVIGGGVIGVCTALYLARDGLRVVLLEKGRIAGEQSGRNWGWIRKQGRDAAELPIMIEAQELWRALAAETNVDIGLRQGGVAYLARDAAKMERLSQWMTLADAHGLDTRLLSGAETRALCQGISGPLEGALYTASDLRAEPWVAVPALAGIAARAGVQIREQCAVRALDIAGGQVAGVVTEAGRIKAPEVVLAGGAWSALFLRRHGVFLPQLSVRCSVMSTQALPEVFAGGGSLDKVAFRHRADGGYTLAPGGVNALFVGPHAVRALPQFLTQLRADPFGTQLKPAAPKGYPDAWRTPGRWHEDAQSPFERMRILDPEPDHRRLARLARDFGALFPKLGTIRTQVKWAGMIDTMPDIVPVVDRVPDIPGLTLGTGMSGHGFGIGPGMGRILSAMVQRKAVGHDLTRFRFERFRDGTPITLGPGV